MTEQPVTQRPRRRLRRAILVLGVGACALAAAWWSGYPQHALIRYGLERVLGAEVALHGLHTAPALEIGSLTLREPGAAQPAIVLDGLDIAYQLAPADGRYVPRLSLEKLDVRLLRPHGVPANYQFIADFLNAPSSGVDPMPFAPKYSEIADIRVDLEQPGMALKLEGLSLRAEIGTLDDLMVNLTTSGATAEWWIESPELRRRIENGALDALVQVLESSIYAELHAYLPGLLEAAAEADIDSTPQQRAFDVRIDHLVFEQADAAALTAGLVPIPLRFDRLDASGTHLKGEWRDGALRMPESEVRLTADGLLAGPPDSPWYQGGLQLEGAASSEAESRLDGTARLNLGQTLRFTVAGGARALRIQAGFDAWGRDDIAALLPAAYRSAADAFPALPAFGATADVVWDGDAASLSGRIAPAGTKAEADISASLPLGGLGVARAEIAARMEKRAVSATLALDPGGPSIEARLERVDPAVWLRTWTGLNTLDPLAAVLSATVRAVPETSQPGMFNVAVRGEASGLRYGDASLNVDTRLTVDLSARLDSARPGLNQLKLDAGMDGVATVAVTKASLNATPLEFKGDLTASAELDQLARIAGLNGLWGSAEASGRIGWRGLALEGNLKILAEPLGYGDFAAPYGSPMEASAGAIHYDGASGAFRFEQVVAGGAGSFLRSDALSGTAAPFTLDGPVTIESDLRALVTLGYLAAAEAGLHGAGTLAIKDGAPAAELTLTLDAARIGLPGQIAELTGALLDAALRYAAAAVNGSGSLRIAQLTAAGVTLKDIVSPVSIHDNRLRLEKIHTALFDGRIAGDLEVSLGEASLPVTINAALDQIDLAAFTREVQPPDVRLTGRTSGTIMVELDLNQLRDLSVRLAAPGGITMNRDLVEQLLVNQYVGEMSGGKQITKVLKKVIGDDEERPFDAAEINLDLIDGRITGVATLKSDALNLTVDIKADPGALLEALRARQQDHVGQRSS